MTQVQSALLKALEGLDPAVFAGLLNGKAPAKQGKRSKAEMLAAKDKSLRATFTKRGYKDVVLMDRTDPTKEFNVRPYGRVLEDGTKTGWIGQGRQVKKGETSVRGLFHISQTDELPVA